MAQILIFIQSASVLIYFILFFNMFVYSFDSGAKLLATCSVSLSVLIIGIIILFVNTARGFYCNVCIMTCVNMHSYCMPTLFLSV